MNLEAWWHIFPRGYWLLSAQVLMKCFSSYNSWSPMWRLLPRLVHQRVKQTCLSSDTRMKWEGHEWPCCQLTGDNRSQLKFLKRVGYWSDEDSYLLKSCDRRGQIWWVARPLLGHLLLGSWKLPDFGKMCIQKDFERQCKCIKEVYIQTVMYTSVHI